MEISERIAYLKGLLEGMDMNADTKEGKIFNMMADILQDIACELQDLQAQSDAVDEDLASLEEFVYEDLDPDFFDSDDDDWCTGDCDNCAGCEELDDFDEDSAEYEFKCPSCGEVVFLDESALDDGDELECPACGAKLEIELSDEDDDFPY